jgi:O-antigen ligase
MVRISEDVLLGGLLFVLPFSGLKTVEEILFYTLIAAFAADKFFSRGGGSSAPFFPDKPLDILLGTTVVWALVCLVGAIDPAYSLNEIANKMVRQYLLYFVAFSAAYDLSSGARKVRRFFYPIAASALLMSSYACYQFYESPVFFYNRVTGFTGAFYRLSVFLVLSMPVVGVLTVVGRRWMKWPAALILAVSFAALFFTFTRSAWIAVTAEALVFIIIFFRKYRKILLGGIVAIVVVAAIAAYRDPDYRQLIVHGSEQPRIQAFHLSARIISEHPLTGIGFGKRVFARYYPEEVEVVQHAHNIFLNTAVETGIPGLVLFAALWAVIIKTFAGALKRGLPFEKKIVLSGILVSVIGFLVLNMFDYMYIGWPGQVCWILVGLGHALIRSEKAKLLLRINNL